MRLLKKCVLILLVLFIILTINPYNNSGMPADLKSDRSQIQSLNQLNINKKIHSYAYIDHSRIEIDEESDFQTLGFNGDGSGETPYIIEDLNITQIDESNCLSIRDIHAYIIIRSNFFDGAANSQIVIYLENVSYVTIEQNQIIDGTKGIYLTQSQECEILSNSISGFHDGGIVLDDCSDCSVTQNSIEDASSGAIKVTLSPKHNLIAENTIIGGDQIENTGPGIYADWSNVTVRDNNIIGHYDGIYLPHCNGSLIKDNVINKSDWGIRITGNENTISNNWVERFYEGLNIVGNNNIIESNQILYGINGIDYQGNSSTFTKNTIFNCTGVGIEIRNPSTNNLIKWNDFVWNGLMADSQAYVHEGSGSNTFNMNYWDDLAYPDENDDGTVDNPYLIPVGLPFMVGTTPGNITDDTPLTTAYNSFTNDLHYFNRPRIISMLTSPLVAHEVNLTKTITIMWMPALHSTHTVTYSVYYSSYEEGIDIWVAIAENISENSCKWDTRELVNSGGMCCFSLKVIGTCSEGLSIEYETASFYGVTNNPASWDLSIFLMTLCAIALFIRKKR